MKKLLAMLGAIGMTATAGVTVVACGNNNKEKPSDQETITAKLTDKIHVNDETNLTVDEKFDIDKIEISYDKDIIEVNKDSEKHLFVIKGLKVGESKITLKLEGYKEWTTTLKVLEEGQEILDIEAELVGKLEKVGDKATIVISNYEALDFVEIGNTNSEVISTSEIIEGKIELEVLATGKATINLTAENAHKKEFEFNIEAEEPEPDPDTTVKVTNLDKRANWIETGIDGEIHAQINNYENLKNVHVSTNNEVLKVINDNGTLHIVGIQSGETELTVTADEMNEFKTTIFVVDELINFVDVVKDASLLVNDDSIESVYEAIKNQNPLIAEDTKFFSEKGEDEGEYLVWTNNYVGTWTFVCTERANISNIEINSVEIKDNMDAVKTKISRAIYAEVGFEAKEGEDYLVKGNTANANESIVVTAIASSFKLFGQFEINVNKFDISKLELGVKASEVDDINGNIAPQVAKLIRNAITEPISAIDLGTDYLIEANLPKDSTYGEDVSRLTVTSVADSKYIQGSFDIVIEANLADININLKGVIGLNDEEALSKIDAAIQELSPGSVIYKDWIYQVETLDEFEVVKITATEDSTHLLGSTTVVRRINIENWSNRVDINGLTPSQAKEEINQLMKNIPDVNAQEGIDWNLESILNKNDNLIGFKVNAGENSNIFKGSFEISLNRVDISSIDLKDEMVDIENETEVFAKVYSEIKKIAPEATMNDWEITKTNEAIGDYSVMTVTAKEESTAIFGSFKFNRFKITDQWDLKPYATDHKIWAFASGFKFDENKKLESINLTNEQWSKILWTGMLDARENEEAWADFDARNISDVLHFIGNPNKVFSDFLKGKTESELIGGVELERVGGLGVELTTDLISYTNSKDLHKYILRASHIQFQNLKVFLDITN